MLKEFKSFVMRGNLIELATAFILGLAFAAVVTSFTDMVLGLISYLVGGDVSFDGLGVHRGTSIVIPYGRFLTAVVSFLIVAAVLFFVVKAYNRAAGRKEEELKTEELPVLHDGYRVRRHSVPELHELPGGSDR
jgi:large conductance mechanosensitive channel